MRTGGRKKGTPNKRSAEAQAICDRLKFDPFETLCHLARADWEALGYSEPIFIDPAIRVKAAAEATKYVYSQRKAIEHSTGEEGFKIILEDYSKPK